MTKTISKIAITAALVGLAPFAFAQTTGSSTDTGYTTTSATSSTTPGTPNTGAGGDAATNAVVLTLSGLVAVAGLAFLARTRKVA